MANRKNWNGLDLFKLIAALLIVFLHTYNGDWGVVGNWVKTVLSTSCVPLFFLVSGFLFRQSMERNLVYKGKTGEKEWFKHYLSRIVNLYIVWSVLTLPIDFIIINRGHPDFGLGLKAVYLFRLFFFTGSIGFYWYLLALPLSVVIIRWFYFGKRMGGLMVVSSLLFLWGCIYNSPFNHRQPWLEILHIVFGSERNFLNVGLFYVLIGFLFPVDILRIKASIWKKYSIPLLLICIVIRSFEVSALKTNYTTALVAVSTFLVAISYDFKLLSRVSLNLRKLSIGVYLLHCPFILLFDFYLKKGTIIDFPVTLAFSLTAFCLLSWLFPQYSKLLFGYSAKAIVDGQQKETP